MTEERREKANLRYKRYRNVRKDDSEFREYIRVKNRESSKR